MKDVLYKTLLEKGVLESHILEMKETLNISEYPYEWYYDVIKEEEKNYEHVPLSKIKSLGFRGTDGISWFDHACYHGTDNIDVLRCHRAYEHLEKESLEEFHQYYKRSPVRLIHFIDDDFYAVYGDGTHRTLWAKVTGSPTIYAVVTRAKKNPAIYKAYQQFKALEAEFNYYLKSNDLNWDRTQDYSGYSDYSSDITYKGTYLWYYPIYRPDKFESHGNLNFEMIRVWKKQQQSFKEDYIKVLQYKKQFHTLIRLIPRKWETKLISFFKEWSEQWRFSEGKAQLRKVGFDMFCIDRKPFS
ncbi:hypothetical protein [Priestia endophytica]|uniref:hypothetical protein n=1 Tax=Priestia endophytica TaxID=135735 RepID=UPI0022804CBE|nr:hypothetical protein [Priestia endophytica]MCY8231711.1 hypothetical protein [Priestia endophytica]